jgi:hypothetical protein
MQNRDMQFFWTLSTRNLNLKKQKQHLDPLGFPKAISHLLILIKQHNKSRDYHQKIDIKKII